MRAVRQGLLPARPSPDAPQEPHWGAALRMRPMRQDLPVQPEPAEAPEDPRGKEGPTRATSAGDASSAPVAPAHARGNAARDPMRMTDVARPLRIPGACGGDRRGEAFLNSECDQRGDASAHRNMAVFAHFSSL